MCYYILEQSLQLYRSILTFEIRSQFTDKKLEKVLQKASQVLQHKVQNVDN